MYGTGISHLISDGQYDVAVLLSGGIDSAVLLEYMRSERLKPIAVHFAGLSSPAESAAAHAVAEHMQVRCWSIDMSSLLLSFRSTRITEEGPGERAVFGAATMYSAASAFAIAHRIDSVAIGLHREDAEIYIEQSPAFLDHIRQGLKLVGSRVQVLVPFQDLSKSDVVQKGCALGVEMSLTWSCLRPSGSVQCGTCVACSARRTAFKQAAVVDATRYENA
ncbi:7-cyano-7-deazaguanine synthase [Streptomyces europaeiscabiei]|uniref:7-cyano-7-deazaguanine synthase n=1 Tax=Streptomyces europaeiscabiei TaxID=146819 RepID=UPI003990D86E